MIDTSTRLALTPYGARSFTLDAGTLDDLAARLGALGFWKHPARSPHETLRLRSGRGAVVVCYRSGTVLVQGQHQEQTMHQLRRLGAAESEVQR